MKRDLRPTLEDLSLECVLMQAWKKTSTYLRYHSWYADTLGLDIEALRIPEFIREIQARLKTPEELAARPLHIVPAPKNQRWAYVKEKWSPQEKTNIQKKLRPLAHVDLQDQVIATAMMLCLADRVETRLGDPRLSVTTERNRKKTLAYGHRLFCDEDHDSLRHRWGSSKLYRSYFQDYQTFLERPKIVAMELKPNSKKASNDTEIAIVQSDLANFYDRVRPSLLHSKLRLLRNEEDEDSFFQLAERLFDWRWTDDRPC